MRPTFFALPDRQVRRSPGMRCFLKHTRNRYARRIVRRVLAHREWSSF